MNAKIETSKRDFLKGALVAGVATGIVASSVTRANAQSGEQGPSADSVLTRVMQSGVLRVGYATTGPWFYHDAMTGELGGIYKDVADSLARELGVGIEYKEVTFGNSVVGLRRGDFDVFGSSLTYTLPRAVSVNFIGPMWSKGSLMVIHKDNASKFSSLSDLNNENVTFSVKSGDSEEARIPTLFPKAKILVSTGQLGAEAVQARRADAWITGDTDAILFARRNSDWATVFNADTPFDRRPNTWAIPYGDPDWKSFLDMWSSFLNVNGEIARLFEHHVSKLEAA